MRAKEWSFVCSWALAERTTGNTLRSKAITANRFCLEIRSTGSFSPGTTFLIAIGLSNLPQLPSPAPSPYACTAAQTQTHMCTQLNSTQPLQSGPERSAATPRQRPGCFECFVRNSTRVCVCVCGCARSATQYRPPSRARPPAVAAGASASRVRPFRPAGI